MLVDHRKLLHALNTAGLFHQAWVGLLLLGALFYSILDPTPDACAVTNGGFTATQGTSRCSMYVHGK